MSPLCLGLGAFLAATVLAQEIIAPEEWFESMKIAQGLVARHDKRHSSRRRQNHHHKNSVSYRQNKKLASSSSPKLAKRKWGYPSRHEIEHRATEFKSFEADEIVDAPASLHIVKEPIIGKAAGVTKMEKASKKAVKKAAGKVKKAAGKGGKKHEK
ncbi:hypothetical protein BGZ96_004106 [Linnemannia gamsii]|uniref:Uncharacterized protein n=1 Tax=Linnemannia gamsii TaxID=64522 RepID=A0ABQ7K7J9_9FUNG|nr:hypothetical protein BGZ96_004106 [Linnemannia gamsii]